MKRMLILVAIFLGSSIAGLLVAGLFVPDMGVGIEGFLVAAAVFTIAQAIVTPLVTRLAKRFSPPLVGVVGLISTWLALWIASLFPGGITFATPAAWLFGTLVMWLVTALGCWLLPMWLLKKTVSNARDR